MENTIGGNIGIQTLEVAGILPALEGMRNPMDSWDRGDSSQLYNPIYQELQIKIGENDLKLAKKLIRAGSEHRKFLRQIQVWADVIMPRYWWQEADTYKFGTKNSCSTMHTLMKSEITLDNFYIGDDPIVMTANHLELYVIPILNEYIELYKKDKDYRWVIEMKRVLPESFIQMRTWNTNYEELLNMYKQRKHHKLKEEWSNRFCIWCESLPYFKEMCLDTLGL